MSFTHRLTQVKDLEACFSLLREKYIYDGPARKNLLVLWRLLITEKACVSVVIEDRRMASSRRQVGFGINYFVTDGFIEQAKTKLPPFLALQIIRQWKRGPRPFLLRKEIDKANAGKGVNLCVPHYGWDTDRLSPEDVFRVRALLQECFMAYHGGYHIKEMVHEAHGPEVRDLLTTAGERVLRDYQEYKGTPFLKGVGPEDYPYLCGCTLEEAWKQPGSFVALMLGKTYQPRFRFSDGERKKLERALLGETDDEIATSLEVSTWAVKKRWQAIYQKVMAAGADLLAEMPKPKAKDNPTRQRRRFLLDYLRAHPEEIRAVSVKGS